MTRYIRVIGAVQGIGFRPFVCSLAEKLNIAGEVLNTGGIVEINASGSSDDLDSFERGLKEEAPFGALVLHVESEPEKDKAFSGFRILESRKEQMGELPVFPPDLGICPDCSAEMNSRSDRRYAYPLISCVSCGPRYSVLESFPYDRENTTMKVFPLCSECSADYRKGRRRHAQTISCHSCGPQVRFFERVLPNGTAVPEEYLEAAQGNEAMERAAEILSGGGILAIKGIGGYQLCCSPCDDSAVRRLREMKGREKQPFAVLFPSSDAVRERLDLTSQEEKELESAARPIVLVKKRAGTDEEFSSQVCGDSDRIGVFLPSVGIQEILARKTGPFIVTSANLHGEPIPIDDRPFLEQNRLHPDGILTHDRKILRPMDDSVIFCYRDRTIPLRRSRGYVPMPVFLRNSPEKTPVIFAAGGDLKGVFALSKNRRTVLSQYFGDLSSYAVQKNYSREAAAMEKLFETGIEEAAADLHPGYRSRVFAEALAAERGIPLLLVQHHHAHIASVMAEHGLNEVIGVALDGTGCGTDGQLWGGEILLCRGSAMERCGSLSQIKLLGSDAVSVSAELASQCYMYALGRSAGSAAVESGLRNNINTVLSTSTGRFFDAAAAVLGIRSRNSYEGECAQALERAASVVMPQRAVTIGEMRRFAERICRESGSGELPEIIREEMRGREKFTVISQENIMSALLRSREQGISQEKAAALFHALLILGMHDAVLLAAERSGIRCAALSGGVFANRIMLRTLDAVLRSSGLEVYFNENVPGNDGGIALGQAYIAALRSAEGKE